MPLTATSKHPSSITKAWVDWTNLTLGVFLAVSPWLALDGGSAVRGNAVACGIIIAIAAGAALSRPNVGAEWINGCLGLWLMIAPWMLGFAVDPGAALTSLLVGFGVICFAGLQLSLFSISRGA